MPNAMNVNVNDDDDGDDTGAETTAAPAKTKAKTTKAAKGKARSKAKKAKAKSAAKPAAKPAAKKGKKAASKKGNGAAKPKKTAERSADYGKAEDYARKIAKDYGSVTVIRAVSQKYGKIPRADVLAIADKLGINKFTASRQFHVARSGEVEIDLNAL